MYRVFRNTGGAEYATCHETLDDALLFYNRTVLACRHITLQDDNRGIIKEHKKIWMDGKYQVVEIDRGVTWQ